MAPQNSCTDLENQNPKAIIAAAIALHRWLGPCENALAMVLEIADHYPSISVMSRIVTATWGPVGVCIGRD